MLSSGAALPASGDHPGQQVLVNDPPNVGLLVARWTGSAWVVDPVSDTGWRRIAAASLVNGWTAAVDNLLLRRAGGRCSWVNSVSLVGTANTGDVFYTVPAGFRPYVTTRFLARYAGNAPVSVAQPYLTPGGEFTCPGGSVLAALYLTADWRTDEPWPTTLPGTAV